jgi:hypothetical protein
MNTPQEPRIDVPGEHRCLCLFEATGPEAVRSVTDIAQFPLARVVAVHSWVPDGTSPVADLAGPVLMTGPDRGRTPRRYRCTRLGPEHRRPRPDTGGTR